MEMQPNSGFFKGENNQQSFTIPPEMILESDQEGKNAQDQEIKEIVKKLEDERMNKRYEQEMENAGSGAEFDKYWLASYRDSLLYWKSGLIDMSVTKESDDVINEIIRRVSRILEALEKSESKNDH